MNKIVVQTLKIAKHQQTIVETHSDAHAVSIWLKGYARRSKHTQRNFKREAMRFLMWLDATKGTNPCHLPDVTVEDVNLFLDYLFAPYALPTETLLRFETTRQPSQKSLMASSMKQTILILYRMFEALRNVRGPNGYGYIQMNPWMLVHDGATNITDTDEEVENALTVEEWDSVFETIESLPKETMRDLKHYHRTRWLFRLMYYTWYRRENLAKLCMGDFVETKDGWVIRQIVKGGKKSKLIATNKLMNELRIYREFLGLPPLPLPGETRPAVMSIYGQEKPISDQVPYLVCKVIFGMTADNLLQSDQTAAQRLRKASTHWMRHTGISHALNSNKVSMRVVQAHANHSSPNTTARYDHKDKKQMREDLEKL